jgi:hypothetical protein
MKNILATLLLCTTCCITACAQTFSEKDFKTLHGLVGLWKMETSRGVIYEEWKLENDHLLKGRSYKLNNTDTVVLEQVRLFLKGNTITYSPLVSKQNNGQEVPFQLISNADKRYVFENKEHDFPQRVIYQLGSNNVLQARIEGTKNGKQMGSYFNYSRVK